MKNPPFPEFKKWRVFQDASKGAAAYMPRASGRFCGAILYQGGCSFHGVCLDEHTHCGVAIALEGGETTVESGVDVLVRGLFSLKLTCDIHETGEQLLFWLENSLTWATGLVTDDSRTLETLNKALAGSSSGFIPLEDAGVFKDMAKDGPDLFVEDVEGIFFCELIAAALVDLLCPCGMARA